MKNYLFSILIITTSLLSVTSNAQESNNNFYVVAEAGMTSNSFTSSIDFPGLTIKGKSGASFGAAIGYRQFTSNNLLFGFEASYATSGGSSLAEDDMSTLQIDTDYIWGTYLTLGGRFGPENNVLAYTLIGIGGTSLSERATFIGDTPDETANETGNGISIGAAIETTLTDNLGIRLKVLHNMYKEGEAGTKVRDTSIMAGLVLNF